MHEVFYTRNDVRNSVHKEKIMSQYNCVLVHPVCHPHGHGTSREYELCAAQIIKFEGLIHVREWLEATQKWFPHTAPTVLAKFALTFQVRNA